MKVFQAKQAAKDWVVEHMASYPDFAGAYLFGSTMSKGDEEEFSQTSDLDVGVVLERESFGELGTPQYLLHRGVLLNVAHHRRSGYRNLAALLASSHGIIALEHFVRPVILFDPMGDLARLREEVSLSFRNESVVRLRCTRIRELVLRRLDTKVSSRDHSPQAYACSLYPQIGWFFYMTMPFAAQIPSMANLGGMTTRKGFVASGKLLNQLGRPDLQRAILEAMGVHDLTEAEARAALDHLQSAFDYAVTVIRTPFFGDGDTKPICRPMVIDGAREVLDAGFHREIAPYIVCMAVLMQNTIDLDGDPGQAAAFRARLETILERLGVSSSYDVEAKADRTRELLPAIMALSEEIIAGHPDIVHGA